MARQYFPLFMSKYAFFYRFLFVKRQNIVGGLLAISTVFKPALSDTAVFNHNLKSSNACEFENQTKKYLELNINSTTLILSQIKYTETKVLSPIVSCYVENATNSLWSCNFLTGAFKNQNH